MKNDGNLWFLSGSAYSLSCTFFFVRMRMYIFLYYISIFNDGDARTVPYILENGDCEIIVILSWKLWNFCSLVIAKKARDENINYSKKSSEFSMVGTEFFNRF